MKFLLLAVGLLSTEPDASPYDFADPRHPDIAKWEDDVAKFEELDRSLDPSAAPILFIGSSSFRLWKSLRDDMAPWPAVRRGYGGAALLDLVHYAPRIMAAHAPRAVVIFVGNDIKGGHPRDRTPEQVAELFENLIGILRSKDSDLPIFYVAVTPTPDRFDAWPKIREANTLVRAVCDRTSGVQFVPTEDIYISADGKPRRWLFRRDKLHQNRNGYAEWAGRIKQALRLELREAADGGDGETDGSEVDTK